jgi:hypothetical protein
LQHDHGPIVQWIEYKIPVLAIWVRVPVGSQRPLIISGLLFCYILNHTLS